MRPPRRFVRLAPLAALLGACAHSPVPNEHALLAATATVVRPTADAAQAAVVIASCVVPASIDRPQLVLTAASGELRVVDTERWSEPLKRAIPRAVARTLMERLPNVTVWSSGAAGPSRPDAKLDLEVVEWRAEPGGLVHVDVLWHLRRGDAARTGRAQSSQAVTGNGFSAIVAAQRAALTAVSDEIAPILGELLHKSHR
ncbi:MAG: membrane integrity-associated transporter subunit PqiC [Burkholderiales bacterium]|nr:membrane integrity-associated transporter subunit PqiC [Burkholderiales bacterium]